MQNDKMVHLANQIGRYFSAYPQGRARDGVLGHIQSFWEPRMRVQLVDYAAAGGDGLHPLVQWAAEQLTVPEKT